MIIGKLDRKLKLYTQTYSTNAYGERVVSDNSYVTIYGDFDFKGGNTNFDADALINDERIECLIRYRTNIGVSPQYFISNGSTNYSIKSIKEIGRKDAMILLLEKNDVVDLSQTAALYISILTTRVEAAGGVIENTTASQQFLQDLNDID